MSFRPNKIKISDILYVYACICGIMVRVYTKFKGLVLSRLSSCVFQKLRGDKNIINNYLTIDNSPDDIPFYLNTLFEFSRKLTVCRGPILGYCSRILRTNLFWQSRYISPCGASIRWRQQSCKLHILSVIKCTADTPARLSHSLVPLRTYYFLSLNLCASRGSSDPIKIQRHLFCALLMYHALVY